MLYINHKTNNLRNPFKRLNTEIHKAQGLVKPRHFSLLSSDPKKLNNIYKEKTISNLKETLRQAFLKPNKETDTEKSQANLFKETFISERIKI